MVTSSCRMLGDFTRVKSWSSKNAWRSVDNEHKEPSTTIDHAK